MLLGSIAVLPSFLGSGSFFVNVFLEMPGRYQLLQVALECFTTARHVPPVLMEGASELWVPLGRVAEHLGRPNEIWLILDFREKPVEWVFEEIGRAHV